MRRRAVTETRGFGNMKRSGHSYFAQRDFYANALFVRVEVVADRVVLRVAAAPSQPFKTPGRMSGEVILKRADVEHVYRCGRVALVTFSQASNMPPTMVSWWVAQELLLTTGIAPKEASRRWCREQVRNG